MIRLSVLVSLVCVTILVWHECGENPAVFCYRIGHGIFHSARGRGLVLAPVRLRTTTACSTRSSTYSARSIARMD